MSAAISLRIPSAAWQLTTNACWWREESDGGKLTAFDPTFPSRLSPDRRDTGRRPALRAPPAVEAQAASPGVRPKAPQETHGCSRRKRGPLSPTGPVKPTALASVRGARVRAPCQEAAGLPARERAHLQAWAQRGARPGDFPELVAGAPAVSSSPRACLEVPLRPTPRWSWQ